jgi:hypothetical protein
MKKKESMIIILILSIILVGLTVAPTTAFKLDKLNKNTVTLDSGKSYITIGIYGQGKTYKKMSANVNKIKTITVKIQGKKKIKIKRPGKTWKKCGYYPNYVCKQIKLKGNVKGKKYVIMAYNNKNKKIKKITGYITSVYKKKTPSEPN